MPERGVHVGVNFTTRLLPPSAEGVIFGEVPLGFRIDHAIETRVILVEIPVLVVVLTPQLGELFLELLEYRTVNALEPRGTVQNLHEPVFYRTLRRAYVDDETR